ncbi:MAG TPA: cation transporter [Casimicrobiaceae bacterium]|nr:cation transporter [Casimicrobiaceae bacterium]
MSSSVSISIATNTAIAIAKGFGWFLTGSPTLFAETVHSLADVGNQVLLKVGELRGRGGPDAEHPFGRSQEKFFWALVSAVSVFFVGCGINVYHGVDALVKGGEVGHFTPLVLGLLLFSLALESWTFTVAWKEIGGWRGVKDNRHDTTVIAVLLEDGVALFGILLTLLVAGSGYVYGPRPEFDAVVAIVVGAILGGMALFLAAINRRVLIDTSDIELDRAAQSWLAGKGIAASVHSLVLDNDRAIVFVRPRAELRESRAVGTDLTAHLRTAVGKRADAVYWEFPERGEAGA